MLSTILIAALLAVVAVGTYTWQRTAYQQQLASDVAPFEADFYRRRHLRRSRISLLLAVVATAMIVGMLIVEPLVMALFWFGVLCLLSWIVLLAMLDASASHAFFTRVRSQQLAEQAALHQAALARQRGAES